MLPSSMKRLAVSSRHRVSPRLVCGVQSWAAIVASSLARFYQSSIREYEIRPPRPLAAAKPTKAELYVHMPAPVHRPAGAV